MVDLEEIQFFQLLHLLVVVEVLQEVDQPLMVYLVDLVVVEVVKTLGQLVQVILPLQIQHKDKMEELVEVLVQERQVVVVELVLQVDLESLHKMQDQVE
tara:strand:- start:239 stop:535 length:297 start_codon:yes stop_codon:yes gene_type:complete